METHVKHAEELVPESWHRTIYQDKSEDKTNVFFHATRLAMDFALGVQTQALNAAVQVAAGGVRMGARAAGSMAKSASGAIPGASVAADVAERVGARAGKLAEDAGTIAKTGTSAARSEIGVANKMAADMLVGPVFGVLALPATASVDAVGAAAWTEPGKAVTKSAAALANAALDALSISSAPTVLDTSRLRETWLAMTTGPGKTAIGNIISTVAAIFRLGIGDTRTLGQALDTAAVSFNYGWQYGAHGLAYPKVPITMTLSDLSGVIVRYLPVTYISALRTGDLWKAANATLEDSENVALAAMTQPFGYFLVAVTIARFLAMGLRDCNDVEEFVKREQRIVETFPELGNEEDIQRLLALTPEQAAKSKPIRELIALEKKRPFTCTEFEFYVGNAKSMDRPGEVARGLLSHSSLPVGVFPQDLIDLAQDTAFWYSGKMLGREAALIRMLRVYGAGVRDRLAKDPSLETDAGLNAAQVQALLDKHAPDNAKLDELKATAREKMQAFDRLEANPDIPVPAQVRARRQFFANLSKNIESYQRSGTRVIEHAPRKTLTAGG